jgi:hypothetical protein
VGGAAGGAVWGDAGGHGGGTWAGGGMGGGEGGVAVQAGTETLHPFGSIMPKLNLF